MPLDTTRPESRRQDIVQQAALLFGAKGFERTSMRDIATAVGMRPGSVYYHFESKDALLAAVYTEVIDRAIAAVEAAVARHSQPWDRLEAAAATHLRLLLTEGTLAAVVVERPKQTSAELVLQRNRYEAMFRRLVADITLPEHVHPGSFRLALLGALNWALTWFRPDGDPPEIVARDLFAVFRANLHTSPPTSHPHSPGSSEITP